ncbi:MAG TPA: tRNA lysidine(34) synthetase TilS [Balneolaceae bacterium]|nr:tRNA lysidine(34) synthetase TilS [Balneolaceae bacterium]
MNKYESSRVRELFLKQLQKLKSDNLHIIVGISGGPDSMAMLYCLYKEGIETTAVHVNYGLRGSDSNKDQSLVEEISSMWGMDCISVNLHDLKEQPGNFQNRARDERYRIFRDLLRELDGTVIATAHHQNDQIETIFQKILRGSGMSAWKGMEGLDGIYFRPLIEVSRESILQFVNDLNIPYRIDRTNEESTYARNFIRNNWFPQLENLFPGWQENVLSLQDRAREYELLLMEKAEKIRTGESTFDRELFLETDPLLQPAIIKYLFESDFPDHTLSKGTLQNMTELSGLQTGAGMSLGPGFSLYRDRDQFYFKTEEGIHSGQDSVRMITESEALEGVESEDLSIRVGVFDHQFSDKRLQADLSALRFPLTLRPWEDGDRFQPFGMDGTQLVSDHLTNRRVASGKKREARVIESADNTIIAVLFPDRKRGEQPGTLSEMVRCSDTTEKALVIETI